MSTAPIYWVSVNIYTGRFPIIFPFISRCLFVNKIFVRNRQEKERQNVTIYQEFNQDVEI